MIRDMNSIHTNRIFVLFTISIICAGCADSSAITNYVCASTMTDNTAANTTISDNSYSDLNTPTYFTQIGNDWFLVDCYHDQVLYCSQDDLNSAAVPSADSLPLSEWHVLPGTMVQPHTVAGDGDVLLVDDTEENKVLVYEEIDGIYVNTQEFEEIGNRPHYTIYDEDTDTFYVWSSMSGEMYLFRHAAADTRMYLTEVLSVPTLANGYTRSFTIDDDEILIVSGIMLDLTNSVITRCRLSDLSVIDTYLMPDAIAGMTQILPAGEGYYVTVSTEKWGSQDAATMIYASSLDDLAAGNYTEVYTENFVGGGTPYYMSQVDDHYYLTEHRVPGHSVWQFDISAKGIANVMALY